MTLDNAAKEKDGAKTPPGPETLQAGSEQTSAVEQLTSKIDAEKQYGGADVKKMVEDALSANGREQKDRADKAEKEVTRLTGELTTTNTNVATLNTQLSEILKAQNEADADKVKDDPVALASLRARQSNAAEALRLQGVVANYEAKNTALTARETEVSTKLTSVNIKLAALAARVDEKTLADFAPDGDPERLKKAANILKQSGFGKAPEIDPKTGKPLPVALTQTPASAIPAGAETKSAAERMLDKAKKK